MQIKLASGRLLILGDIMLDRYWSGSTFRISPEAPVPIVKVEDFEDKPGGAGLVALNAANLSSNILLLGMVGTDDNGECLANLFDNNNIDTYLEHVPHQTITKLRVLSRHQQLVRLDFEDTYYRQDRHERLYSYFNEVINNYDVVTLADYGKGTLGNTQHLISIAKAHHKPVIIAPTAVHDLSQCTDANILILSIKELLDEVEIPVPEEMIHSRAKYLMNALNLEGLLVLRGKAGMVLFRNNVKPFYIESTIDEIHDETGAKETVTAILSLAIASGYDIESAAQLANTAYGIVARKLGAATLTFPELQSVANLKRPNQKILHSIDEAKQRVICAQKAGKKVVFANGCFDILHPGHIAYLTASKQVGDLLLVAVNSDDSVKSLNKGHNRPFFPLSARLNVLAGMKVVDLVMPFNEETPERLIRQLKPDILVKGGDYKLDEVVGAKIVLGYGGQVLTVGENYPECSSTRIIEQLDKGSRSLSEIMEVL